MKKTLFAFFALALLASACAEQTPAPQAAAETPTARATQTPGMATATFVRSALPVVESALRGTKITLWHPWYGEDSAAFESFIREFNKTNVWGVQAEAQGQGNFSNLFENVNAALPTPDKPDLAIALPEQALRWAEQGALADLNLYAGDPLYGTDLSDVPDLFLRLDERQSGRAALPAQRDARLLVWNKTWAGELGFDSPPAAPQDFKQQACRAHEAMKKDDSPQNDFKGGWLVSTDWMTAYAWLNAFGGGALEGNAYRFLTPNNIEAFKFLRQLAEEGCSWAQAESSPAQAFAAREALFISAGLGDLPEVARQLAEARSRDTWEVLAFPGAERDALLTFGSSYVVFKSSAEKELAAWLFIRWMLEAKQDARMVQATHLFPLRESSMALLEDYRKTHPQWRQTVELLPLGINQPPLASWNQAKLVLEDGFAHMYRVNLPSGQTAAALAEMEFTVAELTGK